MYFGIMSFSVIFWFLTIFSRVKQALRKYCISTERAQVLCVTEVHKLCLHNKSIKEIFHNIAIIKKKAFISVRHGFKNEPVE